MWFSVFRMTCIFKPTKKSKYVYSLLLFNESQQPLIEYNKTVNSTTSLVVAISNIQKLHNAGGYYKIQFITCSAKAVVRAERKKIMKKKRHYEIMKQIGTVKKENVDRKKQARDTENKLELQKKRAKQYETMYSAKKQHLLNKQAEKYKTVDSAKKQDLLNKQAEKCKTMDAAKKQDLFNKQAEKYKTMDAAKKEELLQKQKHKYCGNESKSVDSCIDTFKKKIKEGPYYICCVCNRMLYKKFVLQLISNRYPFQHLFNVQI